MLKMATFENRKFQKIEFSRKFPPKVGIQLRKVRKFKKLKTENRKLLRKVLEKVPSSTIIEIRKFFAARRKVGDVSITSKTNSPFHKTLHRVVAVREVENCTPRAKPFWNSVKS